MFLIKCKCGCFFTIRPEAISPDGFNCPNCRNYLELTRYSKVFGVFAEQAIPDFSISVIPDDAKVTVTFDT